MTKKELQKSEQTCRQVHLSTTVSTRNAIRSLDSPEYDIRGIKFKICTMREVVIWPLLTTVVTVMADLATHLKLMSVVVEPVIGYSEHIATARTYGELRPWKGKIDVCPRNHNARQVTPRKQTTVGEIMPANVPSALLDQKLTRLGEDKRKTTTKKKKNKCQKEVLDETDLAGLEEWNRVEQKEAQELITGYASIFAMSDIDLGKTSLVKHSIKLTDNTLYKEWYWPIPPVCMKKLGNIWRRC